MGRCVGPWTCKPFRGDQGWSLANLKDRSYLTFDKFDSARNDRKNRSQITINRMYRHRDFELITVAINRPDEEKSVLDFLQKKQASCRNLLFASADRTALIDAFDPA